MKSALAYDEPVDSDTLIETDFSLAAVPKTDFARDLLVQQETLEAAGNASNLKIVATSRAAVYRVSPYLLKIKPGWNCRDHNSPSNIAHIRFLAGSIAHQGVTEPISVHSENNSFFITNGHCRYLAVMHAINVLGAQIQTVPILQEDKYSSEAERFASQLHRNAGKPLEPLEMARNFSRLRSLGWHETQIAAVAGLTRSRVVQLLGMHRDSTSEVQQLITSGRVTSTFAQRVLQRADSPAEAEALLKDAVNCAVAQGRKRASAKHLPAGIPTKSATVASPARAKSVSGEVDSAKLVAAVASQADILVLSKLLRDQASFTVDGRSVTITMPTPVFTKIRRIAKAAVTAAAPVTVDHVAA
jgi:ParB-like chromosome segregation protein Spo0J